MSSAERKGQGAPWRAVAFALPSEARAAPAAPGAPGGRAARRWGASLHTECSRHNTELGPHARGGDGPLGRGPAVYRAKRETSFPLETGHWTLNLIEAATPLFLHLNFCSDAPANRWRPLSLTGEQVAAPRPAAPLGDSSPGPATLRAPRGVPGQSGSPLQEEGCTATANSYLTVPTNRTGSWGITVSRVRRSSKPTVQMSTWSMRMVPPAGSTRRNKATPSDDFPGDRESESEADVASKHRCVLKGLRMQWKRLPEGDKRLRPVWGPPAAPTRSPRPSPRRRLACTQHILRVPFHWNDPQLTNSKPMCVCFQLHTPFNLNS